MNPRKRTWGARLLDFTHGRVISIRYNCVGVVVHLYCDKLLYTDYTDYTLFLRIQKKEEVTRSPPKVFARKGCNTCNRVIEYFSLQENTRQCPPARHFPLPCHLFVNVPNSAYAHTYLKASRRYMCMCDKYTQHPWAGV